MNPLAIKARNYRTFDELDLDLPTGCVAVLGENGAGKSSIVNLIDLALFGPQSRTLADCLTDDVVEENLELELTFEHAGETWRVRRTYSPRGRGQTKVDLERAMDNELLPDEKWYPLTRETAAATQTAIEELLGLSRETFRASAFLAQGDGAAFTEAVPRDRKRILCEVLGLDLWDKLLERARTDRKAAETELVQVDNTVAGAEAELAGRPAVEQERGSARIQRDAAQLKIESTEQELTTVNEQLAKAKAMQAASKSAEDSLEAARRAHGEALTTEALLQREIEELDLRLGVRDDLAQLADTLGGLEAHADELQKRIVEADEHDRLVLERNRLLDKVRELGLQAEETKAEIEALKTAEDPRCQTCGQHVAGDAKEQALAKLQAEHDSLALGATENEEAADPLTARLNTLQVARPSLAEIGQVSESIRKARSAREHLAALDEAATRRTAAADGLRNIHEKIPTLEQSVKTAQANLRALLSDDGALSLPELDEQHRDLTAGLQGWRNALTAAVETVARCDERLDRMNRLAEAVKLNAGRRDELHGEIDILCELERAYGKDGIPALIVENSAIPQIEVEASRILTELGTSYRVELRTERALKSGEGSRDTLDVIVVGDAGERPYETFSGGERTRINLALRIALARLLAHRRGAESRALIIDEPEYLDEPGTAKLAEVLRSLAQSGDFDKVYLVSHVPGLRDAFDQTITVVKDGNRSRVDAGVEAEAIAA